MSHPLRIWGVFPSLWKGLCQWLSSSLLHLAHILLAAGGISHGGKWCCEPKGWKLLNKSRSVGTIIVQQYWNVSDMFWISQTEIIPLFFSHVDFHGKFAQEFLSHSARRVPLRLLSAGNVFGVYGSTDLLASFWLQGRAIAPDCSICSQWDWKKKTGKIRKKYVHICINKYDYMYIYIYIYK